MKKELTMEELEQVAGGDIEPYFKAIGEGISIAWCLFLECEARRGLRSR